MSNSFDALTRDLKLRNSRKFRGWLYRKSLAGYNAQYALTHPWVIVKHVRTTIKHASQRVFRGWDDTASWAVDSYVAPILLDAVTKIRDQKMGVPVSPELGALVEDSWSYKDPDAAIAEWYSILTEIILGLEIEVDNDYDLSPESRKLADRSWELIAKWRASLWT